jgi:hypothetical protein
VRILSAYSLNKKFWEELTIYTSLLVCVALPPFPHTLSWCGD